MRHFLVVLILLVTGLVFAKEPIPQPLSLEQALDIAREHPAIQASAARLGQVKADYELIDAEDDLNLQLQADLVYIEPSDIAYDQDENDSKAFLKLSSRLYDFGYTDARLIAAGKNQLSHQWQYFNDTQQHLLSVIQLFFDVLLADQQYTVADEEMTMAYLKYDKTRERHDLGTISDVDLLELEKNYRLKFQARRKAEYMQRLSRTKLANAMGRPDEIPSELLQPDVDWSKDSLEINPVLDQIELNSPQIQELQLKVSAAEQQLEAAQAADNPVVTAEMKLAEYARQTGSANPLSVGLSFQAPLYSGGKSRALESQARSSLREQEANLQIKRMEIRQLALELLLEIEQAKTDLDALGVNEDFIELYLDRSRALYELEVSSDLGDALARSSDVAYQKLKAKLAYALAEAKLAALQGNWQVTAESKPDTSN